MHEHKRTAHQSYLDVYSEKNISKLKKKNFITLNNDGL